MKKFFKKYDVLIWFVGQTITVLLIPVSALLMQSGIQPGDLTTLWVAGVPISWFISWMIYFLKNWKQ